MDSVYGYVYQMNAIQHILTHEIDVEGFSIQGTKIPNFTLSTPLKVPKQPNTTDCGLFVIKFMEEYGSVFADYDESKVSDTYCSWINDDNVLLEKWQYTSYHCHFIYC